MASDETVVGMVSAAVQAAVAQLVPTLVEQLKGSHGSGSRNVQGDLVEKLVKRTDHFDGTGFTEWRFRAQVSWTAVHLDGKALMDWAEEKSAGISRTADIQETQRGTDSLLYFYLAAVTKGEAFDLVKNVTDQCGAEAWRKICKRFGSKTKGKRVLLTRRCVSPPKVKKLAEAPGMIEKWEADVRRLQVEYQERLTDGLKSGILLEMVPPQVTEFMTQRMGEDDSYEDAKEAVLRYVETKADFGGPIPMELGALKEGSERSVTEAVPCQHGSHESWDGSGVASDLMAFGGKGGKGGAWGGKGGGKGSFSGQCHTCGEWGHRAAQCPWKQVCFHCGKPGHILSQCPVKTAEMRGGDGAKGWPKGDGKGKGGWQMGGGFPAWTQSKGWPKGGSKGFGGKKGGGKGGLNELDNSQDGFAVGGTQEVAAPAWSLLSLSGEWTTLPPKYRCCRLPVRTPPGLFDDLGMGPCENSWFRALMEEEEEEKTPESKRNAGLHVLVSNDSDLCSFGEMEWFCFDTVMDSGAVDPVAPIDMLDWLPLEESEGSRRGQTWQAAGGEVIPNLGERKVRGYTEEGVAVESIYQVGGDFQSVGIGGAHL